LNEFRVVPKIRILQTALGVDTEVEVISALLQNVSEVERKSWIGRVKKWCADKVDASQDLSFFKLLSATCRRTSS
jgi:hypothetical protein